MLILSVPGFPRRMFFEIFGFLFVTEQNNGLMAFCDVFRLSGVFVGISWW